MCAIIGVLGRNLPDQEQFKKARDTMTHRGPDDAGLYYAPEEGVALGHRRLSIIDLSAAGRQPFSSWDNRFLITFNGEIYNYRELKKELEEFYSFKTDSDTEVLLASYIQWGEKCLNKLNGMFAFAIWDRKKKELFCARDRLGVKPFYYATHNGIFYFASEVKGILSMTGMERKLNKESFLDFLSYRYPLGPKTMFDGVFSLLPGHYMTLKGNRAPILKKYWELPVVVDKKDPGETEAKEKTKNLLLSSIKYRMISDVPIGAYLSGGLDSSLITGMMASVSAKPVKTFSVGFQGEDFNEFKYARKVAKLFNAEHHELVLDGKTYLNAVPETIRFKDAPLAVPFDVSGVLLSKELKKDITVVLAGEGADELFGGYGRIFRSGYDLKRIHKGAKGDVAKNLLKKYDDLKKRNIVDHFVGQYSYFLQDEKRKLLNCSVFKKTADIFDEDFFREAFSGLEHLSQEEQIMHVFERVHLLGLLHRLDNSAMAKSVEAREPYVDYRLIEYVSALPLSYKMKWKSEEERRSAEVLNSDQISETGDISKYLLKEIARDYLPDEIINRKKLGPPAPLEDWFRGEFKSSAKDLLLSSDAKSKSLFNTKQLGAFLEEVPSDGNSRRGLNIWMLTTLELWMREYNVVI